MIRVDVLFNIGVILLDIDALRIQGGEMKIVYYTACFLVTAFVAFGTPLSWTSVTGDFDMDADVDLADYDTLLHCMNGPGVLPGENCVADADLDDDDDIDLLDFSILQNSFDHDGPYQSLPAKNISYDLIGIHDFYSENHNSDCVSCHRGMTNKVASDGVTPTAHSLMLTTFGKGNIGCWRCHRNSTDFLYQSTATLRKQTSIEDLGCAECHGSNAPTGFPMFYVR